MTNSTLATGTDTKLLVAQDTQQVKRASFEGSPGPQLPGSRPFVAKNHTLQRVHIQLAREEKGGRKHRMSAMENRMARCSRLATCSQWVCHRQEGPFYVTYEEENLREL